jgi:DNA-binding NarL/FixJ family response regulator
VTDGSPPSPLRVAIVDDQPLMRAALRTILEGHGLEVVGEAGDGNGAVSLARAARPHVMLMDVRMPGTDGVAATALVRAATTETAVLVLTTFDDDDALHGALAAGATGFLLKNTAPESLVRAVRQVAEGDAVLDSAVAGRVFARFARRAATGDAAGSDRLTEREKDVWRLVGEGLTNAEIAARLGVGEETAKTHVSNLLMKLGVHDRVQAVIRAYETGFLA